MSEIYPTDEELEAIKAWDIIKQSVRELLAYVEEIWWMPDWGFLLTGKNVLRLELHTGGHSGNEDIISALQHNFLFWSLCWRKSTTGGHYWFKIPRFLTDEHGGTKCR